MNLGLRWEIYFPQFVNGKDNGGFQNLSTGEVMIAGENGVGINGNINTALTHFAPRVGLSYQLDPKTVIRTGYGRSYDVGVFGVSYRPQRHPESAGARQSVAQSRAALAFRVHPRHRTEHARPQHHPRLPAQGPQRQSHAAQRRRPQRPAPHQQQHHAPARRRCLELHHRTSVHPQHRPLHRLHRQQGLPRHSRRHQLQHQPAHHRRLRNPHYQPAPPLLPEVRLDPEHQVLLRRCQRQIQFASGARRKALQRRTPVPGQLHLGQRLRFRQRLLPLEPQHRLRP